MNKFFIVVSMCWFMSNIFASEQQQQNNRYVPLQRREVRSQDKSGNKVVDTYCLLIIREKRLM